MHRTHRGEGAARAWPGWVRGSGRPARRGAVPGLLWRLGSVDSDTVVVSPGPGGRRGRGAVSALASHRSSKADRGDEPAEEREEAEHERAEEHEVHGGGRLRGEARPAQHGRSR